MEQQTCTVGWKRETSLGYRMRPRSQEKSGLWLQLSGGVPIGYTLGPRPHKGFPANTS